MLNFHSKMLNGETRAKKVLKTFFNASYCKHLTSTDKIDY